MPFICTLSNKTFQFARKVFPAVFSGFHSSSETTKNNNMKCKDSLGTWGGGGGGGYASFLLKIRA